ncbi:MAG: dockerin type I domain-containing protein, partial [Candidatus Altarchaeaceae archaeon]
NISNESYPRKFVPKRNLSVNVTMRAIGGTKKFFMSEYTKTDENGTQFFIGISNFFKNWPTEITISINDPTKEEYFFKHNNCQYYTTIYDGTGNKDNRITVNFIANKRSCIGDIDKDGNISIFDVVEILEYLNKQKDISIECADVDNNCVADLYDVMLLLENI